MRVHTGPVRHAVPNCRPRGLGQQTMCRLSANAMRVLEGVRNDAGACMLGMLAASTRT